METDRVDTKEQTFRGRGISPSLAQGRAYVYRDILQWDHRRYGIDSSEVTGEFQRIKTAIADVLSDLEIGAEHIERELDKAQADVLRIQQTLVRDPQLLSELKQELESELVNAEEVIKRVLRRWQRRLLRMESSPERDPGDDVADLSRRLLRSLSGRAHGLENLPSGSVVVAQRLLPSHTVLLSRRSAVAVVLEGGGIGSHAALLTREMGVPAVSGITDAVQKIPSEALVLVDGTHGRVTINPEPDTEQRFQEALTSDRQYHRRARYRCHERVRSPDGRDVRVMANVVCPEDARLAQEYGADGVGLYRLEQFYLTQRYPPTEQTLLKEIQACLKPFRDKPVTVRLLDAGGDKDIPFMDLPKERNPFLGRRGVRLLLDYPDITRTQLGALLTLSQEMDLSILVPMVTLPDDIRAIREMLQTLAEQERISVPRLGAMIETPVAALCADAIAEEADFLSFGTNDLTQYTMAADRENQGVDHYYRDDHPAVLYLLEQALQSAQATRTAICGELAADTRVTPKLISLGLREFSVAPFLVPMVKQAIRTL